MNHWRLEEPQDVVISGTEHRVWEIGEPDTSDPDYSHCGKAVVVMPLEDYTEELQAERQATAELIVRAVNCHDELLAALQEVDDSMSGGYDYDVTGCADTVRAAIAKAEAK